MTKKKILIKLLLLLVFVSPVLSQEQPLKDFAEDRRERKFCFYPSTLRMINIANNPDFDELVSGIDKLLIYNLDSATRAGKSYKQILTTYQELEFEEYASAYGGGLNFYVYGKEKRNGTEYIGIIRRDEVLTAFFMKGNIALNKLPQLMQSLSEGDFINPFDFNIDDFGKSTQDQ